MSTIKRRIVRCLGCGYTQKDSVSYYRHKKTWNENHDLKKCAEMKSVMGNSFSAYKQLTWENETTSFRKLA